MSGSEEEGGEEYVVEKILNRRLVKGKVEYFLKWQGFGEEDNTWEPEENLGCPELIEAFEKQWNEKEAKKKAEKEAARRETASKKRERSIGGSASNSVVSDYVMDTSIPPSRKSESKRESSYAWEREDMGGSTKRAKTGRDSGGGMTSSSHRGSGYTPRSVEINGFDRGYRPEKIVGASDSSGELVFLMQWKDSDEAGLVPAKQAKQKCPQIVLSFYEEMLGFSAIANTN